MSPLGRLPLPLGVAIVGGVTAAVIAVSAIFGLGVYGLALLAIPAVLAVVYLREYSKKELRPRVALSAPEEVPSPPVEVTPETILPTDPEPHLTLFDEPVLEASFVSALPPAAPPTVSNGAGDV